MEQQTDDCAPYALVVEDEPLIRGYTRSILGDAGYHPLEACNTHEALCILQAHGYAIRLLFTDVQMPGNENGLVLAHRCNVQWPHIDILLASGQVVPASSELPPRAAFLAKPFSERDVLKALNELAISKELTDVGDTATRQDRGDTSRGRNMEERVQRAPPRKMAT